MRCTVTLVLSDTAAIEGENIRIEDDDGALIKVQFLDEPVAAVTPGQIVALYKDSVCLGGGPILWPEGRLHFDD